MTIVEFFELSAGKWVSQRTSHHLTFQQLESGKSELQIETLPPNNPDVVNLCQRSSLEPSLAVCGVKVVWDGTMEWDKTKRTGSMVLVLMPDPETPNTGKLLRSQGGAETAGIVGRYAIGNDDALTLITENGEVCIEERVWFASPNLRFRTSILKQPNGFSMASFCSEIRMGVTKPAPYPEQSSTATT